MAVRELIDKLNCEKKLSHDEWVKLIKEYDESDRAYAAELARGISQEMFGKNIYIRGIVEFSNICKNDCLYCGIRRSNGNVSRYRLTAEEILQCCDEGYGYGFRTFVLQSGEDAFYDREMLCGIVSEIKKRHPDCAVTLSLGEKSREDYEALFNAGADRYLLRHETADEEHYKKLHPAEMSWKNRMECLSDLKEIGYQTGCGMMIGSPYQTAECIAEDMEFMCDFKPEMIGIGQLFSHIRTRLSEAVHKAHMSLLSFC